MTKIEIFRHNGLPVTFLCKGHAGDDTTCAVLSAVFGVLEYQLRSLGKAETTIRETGQLGYKQISLNPEDAPIVACFTEPVAQFLKEMCISKEYQGHVMIKDVGAEHLGED